MPLPPPGSDADPAVPVEGNSAQITTAHRRAAASLKQSSDAALNYQAPQPLFDATTKAYYFIAAPVPLKQLFGPPLVPGKHTQGGKRIVSSGWGAARALKAGEPPSTATRRHSGLDFVGDVGENVIACADGRIVLIAAQLRDRPSPLHIANPTVLPDGNVTGFVNGAFIEIPHEHLGFGGLYISIRHNGDFQDYVTQYFHLSGVVSGLTEGKGGDVKKGQVIGYLGTTGGSTNGIVHSGPHVHWQVRYQDVIVKPEELVVFYQPGVNPNSQQFRPNLGDPYSSNGGALAQRQGANTIQGMERATNAENQSQVDHKTAHGNYLAAIGAQLNGNADTALQAIATFEQALPVVVEALAFDYDKGLWNDQASNPKAGEGL